MNTTGETTVSAGLPDPDSDEQQEVIEVQILPQVSQQHLSHTVALRDDFLIAICKKDEGWPLSKLDDSTRCLKITVKVSFNIASEASYVYILRGQKLIKNAKNGPIRRVFDNLKLAVKQGYQTGQF